MSDLSYMPLNGALLISNPRKEPSMAGLFGALALDNPNYYRRAQKFSRSKKSQQRADVRSGIRDGMRKQYGKNWHKKAEAKRKYSKLVKSAGVDPKVMLRMAKAGKLKKTSSKRRSQLATAQSRYKREGWHMQGKRWVKGKPYATRGKTRAGAYVYEGHRKRNSKGQFVANVSAIRKSNRRRMAIRKKDSHFNSRTRKWKGGKSYRPKVSGIILKQDRKRSRKRKSTSKRRSTGRKTTSRRKATARNKYMGSMMKRGFSMKEASKAWARKKSGVSRHNPIGRHPTNTAAKRRRANQKHYGALALDNGIFGALALDNYGALALDNPMSVDGVMAWAKTNTAVVVTGVAAAGVMAIVTPRLDEHLAKIPGVSDALDMLGTPLPADLPVIGGLSFRNSFAGLITGTALSGALYLLQRYGSAVPVLGDIVGMISPYSSYVHAISGAMVLGGAVADGRDHFGGGDLGALALDNEGIFGALALDNEGGYGDGMAYQLGGLSEDVSEFGQASLADAYYSGADFDLQEGRALLAGQNEFRRRYGRAPVRVAAHGGGSGASHLAGRGGHRWGWLVKMLGWKRVQQIAKLPPKERVHVIKGLRANAIQSFEQLKVEAQEAQLAAPEMTAAPSGPDGVSGAYSSFGSTIFAGQGL